MYDFIKTTRHGIGIPEYSFISCFLKKEVKGGRETGQLVNAVSLVGELWKAMDVNQFRNPQRTSSLLKISSP